MQTFIAVDYIKLMHNGEVLPECQFVLSPTVFGGGE
jgi:hypothetical protein